MKEIDKIAWIEIQDGKILSTKSKGKEKYYLPGGKRELGENDEQALTREILEELNIDIAPNSLKYIGTFKAQADGHKEGVIVKMTCYRANYVGVLKANNEIEVFEWLNYKDLDRVSAVDKIIFKYLHEKGDLE